MAPSSMAGPNRGRASAIGEAASEKATAPRMGMVHARMTALRSVAASPTTNETRQSSGGAAAIRRGRAKTPGVVMSMDSNGRIRLCGLEIARSLLAALGHDVVADLLAFHLRAHPGALDRADVHEYVFAAVAWLDES